MALEIARTILINKYNTCNYTFFNRESISFHSSSDLESVSKLLKLF